MDERPPRRALGARRSRGAASAAPGIGRARGAIALRTCAEPRVVTWDPPIGRPVWWFPYDGALVGAARAVAGLRSARDRDRERAWRRDGFALLRVTGRWLRAMRRSG